MNESKATRYHRWRRRAEAAGLVSAGLMLALIALTPASRWLAGLADTFTAGWVDPLRPAVTLVVFVLLLVLLWELAALPATAYVALRIDSAYGRGTVSIEDVLGAQAYATAVALPAALVAAGTVRLAVHVAGPMWWAVAGPALGAALAAALHGAPMLLARLGDVRRFARPDLADRLMELARRAGVPVASIDEWKIAEPARTTAVVTGVGSGRRVLVSAGLVRDWTDEEIAVVVAHELAHHAYRDLWRTWVLNTAVLAGALFAADRVIQLGASRFGLGGPGDLAALPLAALVACLTWIAATPLRHALSRRQERRADAFALVLTGEADAFRSAVRRLGARYLAEERPSVLTRWLYLSHPPVAERLALAELYRRKREGRLAPATGSAVRR